MKIKKGVVFHPETIQRPAMLQLLYVVSFTAPKGYEPTITSACEGRHSTNPWSKHYTGWALDFRRRDYGEDIEVWIKFLQNVLGRDYYILLEPTHIHIHYNKED